MAFVVWFTGLPGCGKTTIAKLVQAKLFENGVETKLLQLDEIRRAITPVPSYTEEERDVVYASLAYMAKLLADVGVNVIIDATANRQKYRDLARQIIPNFGEVFIQAPLDVCKMREESRNAEFSPHQIYKKAKSYKATVPGVNVPYERPRSPEIDVDTVNMNPEDCARFITEKIINLFIRK